MSHQPAHADMRRGHPLALESLAVADASQLASLSRAIGDPVRLRLLSLIASCPEGEICVCDLLANFKVSARTGAVRDGSMFEPPDVPPPAAQADELRCEFGLPTFFRSWEEPDGEFLRDQPTMPAAVDAYNGGVALYLAGEPAFGLVHVGAGEFRFAGWTAERTIQPSRSNAGDLSVTLRSRVGSRVSTRTIPAAPIPDGGKHGAQPKARASEAVTARAGMS